MKHAPVEFEYQVNDSTSSLLLETISGDVLPNNKEWYSDLETLGKHFLVNCTERGWLNRHYTTCNAMSKPIYDELVKWLVHGA
jgi:hypothetical protein